MPARWCKRPPGDDGQLKFVLSFALDPKRFFGFDISSVHGRWDDILDREDAFAVSIDKYEPLVTGTLPEPPGVRQWLAT